MITNPKGYISINKKAYDDLASEFEKKIEIRKINQEKIVKKFENFLSKYTVSDKSVLEIGPAAGYTTKLLCEDRYKVTAIEISPKLSEICKRIAPKSEVITDDFLNHGFGDNKYSGILAIAFIHLFPKNDTQQVLKKICSLLISKGIAYISTTLSEQSGEGFERKINFEKENVRFRRRFTQEELEQELQSAGFLIVDREIVNDGEENGKNWMDYMVQKK
jgi:SAM-dependent methyltransferase